MVNSSTSRKSPVAGTWYAGSKESLEKQIIELFENHRFGPGSLPIKNNENPENMLGIIAPHAGYMASGTIAAHSYKALAEAFPKLDTAIVLGPFHRGGIPDISVYPSGKWSFPNGDLDIDVEIVEFLRSIASDKIEFETSVHLIEHSIDIQMPFLRFLYEDTVKIIPISIPNQNLENGKILSKYLFKILGHFSNKKIAIIASSDLSHEYDYGKLLKHDENVLQLIQAGDAEKLEKYRKQQNVTMCGYCPIYTLMFLANKFNGTEIRQLKYGNSREILGKSDGYTVGYPSFGFYFS